MALGVSLWSLYSYHMDGMNKPKMNSGMVAICVFAAIFAIFGSFVYVFAR